ncbi:MAG: DUF885 domain-containing protein [Gammaproteobacteria bacterium]|nr:DUF885 domain-containing protein [Gammaproteobacteria bacterium]
MRPHRCVSLLAGVSAAFLAACTSAPVSAARGDPEAELARLVDEYFEESLRLSPLQATFIGDRRYDDRLENPASAAYAEALAASDRRFLAGARAIDPVGLVPDSRLSLEVFVHDRELALEGAKFPAYLLPIDQFSSLATLVAVLGSGGGAQPFRDVRDYESFLKRSHDFVIWADTAIESMREGARRGVTQPRVLMQKAVPQLREIADVARPEDSVFWRPIANMPPAIAAPERARLERVYRAAITREILPAYRRLADFIERDYLPVARTSVAWTALPGGEAWYRHLVRMATTTDMTPEEIHAIGLAEVARIRGEMERVKTQVGFAGDLHAFFRFLQDDPRFYYTSGPALLQGYRDLKKRIDALLPKLFSDFPKADYEVREVESFRAASSAGAFYAPPSADGSRPGLFYVNTYNLRAQPKFDMETLSLHEASPGHHFQIAIQQELADLPRFRRFNGYVAYQEGWALYCESLGRELGLFTDPYQWYGHLNDEMLRAMRLVVDTGLHSQGWSRERAIRYMLDNSSLAESDVVAEVERYIAIPGQALGYKIGQLRISALRARAEAALGARFDIRAFHSLVLRKGALPLAVLEAEVDRWIGQQVRTAG